VGNATLNLREQVKDVLRSLAPHDIKYNELVGEGVDPYILQGLYDDLDPRIVQAKPSSPTNEVGQVSVAQKTALHRTDAVEGLPARAFNDAGQGLQQATTTTDTTSKLVPVNSEFNSQTALDLPDAKKAPRSVAVSTEKTPGAASSNVAMERKDRIAQLLAAKTGKTAPPRLAPEKQPDIPAKIVESVSPVEAAKKPLSLPEKPPLPSPELLIKPKNKAQTDLIRQKMEALKKEALAKSQVSGTANGASVNPSPIPTTPSFSVQPQPSGSTGYVAEAGPSGLASQIPGLFMTSEASPSHPNGTNGTTDHAQTGMVNDRVSIKSTATSVSQGTSLEFEEEFVRSPGGQIPPVRLPQKRPLASDSFEEPMPSPKRPFGLKDSYDKVEIVVSDAESEGEVEDVEMELDEESDEEKQTLDHPVIPSLSLRESNIRNLPPLTGIPPPRLIAQSASSIGTPTSTAVQTPGREKDKEELWRAKHQEIELMRKKIAEMEERRKAKQNATRPVSPKAVGKPPLSVIRTSLARPTQPSSAGLADMPVAAKAQLASDALQSPVLAASRPEDLLSTPSTPLYAIKEPVKAEDLRQQLLRRKATREATPSTAEIEIRQTQLAQKREKLAALRREAEKREAEILEEAKLLEAQLQAGLDDQEAYDQQPRDLIGDLKGDSNARDERPLESLQQTPSSGVDAGLGGSPSAVKDGDILRTEGLTGEADSRGSSADSSNVVRQAAEDSDIPKSDAFSRTLTSLAADIYAAKELQNASLDSRTDQQVEMATVLQQGHSLTMPVTESGRMHIDPPSGVHEDKPVDEAGAGTVGSNLVDEDGSVSMSDSGSEDYEPAEPDQIGDDQPENESELYEPADAAVPPHVTQPSTCKEDELAEPIEVDELSTENSPQSMSPITKNRDPPILIDDAEDGMQLTEPDIFNKPQITSQSRENESNDKVRARASHLLQSNFTSRQIPQPVSHFTPYKTPRIYFKNFRYHDHFPEMVSSGYKSLTFSNNIDPRRPFCPTELAGQACEDPTCEEQHFRQVALTGACNRSSQYLRVITACDNAPLNLDRS
jgi:Putative zinc-finger domain